jgi:hypothetical protein
MCRRTRGCLAPDCVCGAAADDMVALAFRGQHHSQRPGSAAKQKHPERRGAASRTAAQQPQSPRSAGWPLGRGPVAVANSAVDGPRTLRPTSPGRRKISSTEAAGPPSPPSSTRPVDLRALHCRHGPNNLVRAAGHPSPLHGRPAASSNYGCLAVRITHRGPGGLPLYVEGRDALAARITAVELEDAPCGRLGRMAGAASHLKGRSSAAPLLTGWPGIHPLV